MIHARNDYQRIQDPENKIPADEPVFLLRGQDKTAAAVVRYWVKLNKKELTTSLEAKVEPEQIQRQKKAIALADAHAFRMEDWPKKKVSDV